MSLVQKLRKMDNLDIERTRDDEQAEKTGETAQERQVQDGESAVTTPENAVPSSRPLTRSLTGRASKPRARDDSLYEAPKKSPAGRKKAPPKLTRKRTIDEVDGNDKTESEEQQDELQESPAPAAPITPEPPTVPPLNNTPAVFVDPLVPPSGPQAGPSLSEHRNPRSRTNLPIPVPNLIKKSRGRRVPTIVAAAGTGSGTGTEESASTSKRLHVCKVEGCGKCFHRGEHLKRHIRSIHTHEKPFPCTFPSCHKFFNRHDNLLQHVKVHRSGDEGENDVDAEGSPAPDHGAQDDSSSASPVDAQANDGFNAARLAAMSLQQHSTAITYPTLGAPMTYGPTTYATNMSVSSLRTSSLRTSSLRTELPESLDKADADTPQREQEQEQEDDEGRHQGRYAQEQGHYAAPQVSEGQHFPHPQQYAQQQYDRAPDDSALRTLSDASARTPPAVASDSPQMQHTSDVEAAPPMPLDMHFSAPDMHDADADATMDTDVDLDADAEVDVDADAEVDTDMQPAPEDQSQSQNQEQQQPQQQQKPYYRLRTPPPPV